MRIRYNNKNVAFIYFYCIVRSFIPPHKTPPDVWGGSSEVGPGPYTRPALSARIMPHTSPQAYTTHYPVSPNHAHCLWPGRNWRDSQRWGITSNCSWSHSLGEPRHIPVPPSLGIRDRGAALLLRAGIRLMERGRRRILRVFCPLRGQRRR